MAEDIRVIYLANNVPLAVKFEQLEEECMELALACRKIARKLRRDNPTPANMMELMQNLDEETADVALCLRVLGKKPDAGMVESKLERWVGRVEGSNVN